jgi:hypothetical protein
VGADGSTVTVDADGSTVTTGPDGTVVTDNDNDTDSIDGATDSPNELISLLAVRVQSEEEIEVWVCDSANEPSAAFLFIPVTDDDQDSPTDNGGGTGFQLAPDLLENPNISSVEDVANIFFTWEVTAADAILIEAADTQADWTTIRFSSDDTFTANSGSGNSFECNRTVFTSR